MIWAAIAGYAFCAFLFYDASTTIRAAGRGSISYNVYKVAAMSAFWPIVLLYGMMLQSIENIFDN